MAAKHYKPLRFKEDEQTTEDIEEQRKAWLNELFFYDKIITEQELRKIINEYEEKNDNTDIIYVDLHKQCCECLFRDHELAFFDQLSYILSKFLVGEYTISDVQREFQRLVTGKPI